MWRHARGRFLQPTRNLHSRKRHPLSRHWLGNIFSHRLPRLLAANQGLNLGRRVYPSVYPSSGIYCLESGPTATRFLCQHLEHHIAHNCRDDLGCLRVACGGLAVDFQQDIPRNQD